MATTKIVPVHLQERSGVDITKTVLILRCKEDITKTVHHLHTVVKNAAEATTNGNHASYGGGGERSGGYNQDRPRPSYGGGERSGGATTKIVHVLIRWRIVDTTQDLSPSMSIQRRRRSSSWRGYNRGGQGQVVGGFKRQTTESTIRISTASVKQIEYKETHIDLNAPIVLINNLCAGVCSHAAKPMSLSRRSLVNGEVVNELDMCYAFRQCFSRSIDQT